MAHYSAVPLFGAAYLQKVRAVWPWIVAHPSWSEPEVPAAYAVLLSAQARLVRVVTPFDPSPEPSGGLSPFPPTDRLAGGTVLWLNRPAVDLPRVLTPASPR